MKLTSTKLTNSWPFLLGLILGMYFVLFHFIGVDFSYYPGDYGDARFNNYILEHAHRFFTGQEESYWNAPFIYPEESIITYSDNLLGTAPVYSSFRFVGFDMETSFQFWVIVMFILNYTCTYFFLKWSFKRTYPAVLGAFIFTFSIALQPMITHAQLFPRFFIPLAIWMCLLFMKELKPIYFFSTLFFVVLQFYAGIYLGFMLAIPIAIMLILILFVFKRKLFFDRIRKVKWLVLAAGSVLFNFFLLALLMWPYFMHSKKVGDHTYASVIDSVPTLRSFFYVPKDSLLWDSLSNTCKNYESHWDHQLFPGAISILCLGFVLIALVFRKKWKMIKDAFSPMMLVLFIAGILTFLLFTRYQGFSLYELVYNIPGFSSMRSLTRIINIELLFFAIAVAFAANLLFKKYSKIVVPLFLLFLSLIVVDNYVKENYTKFTRVNKVESQGRIEALKAKMKSIPEGGIVSYEPKSMEDPPFFYQLDAMLASQALGLKTVNGYTAIAPDEYSFYWNEMSEEARLRWFSHKEFYPDTVYVVE